MRAKAWLFVLVLFVGLAISVVIFKHEQYALIQSSNDNFRDFEITPLDRRQAQKHNTIKISIKGPEFFLSGTHCEKPKDPRDPSIFECNGTSIGKFTILHTNTNICETSLMPTFPDEMSCRDKIKRVLMQTKEDLSIFEPKDITRRKVFSLAISNLLLSTFGEDLSLYEADGFLALIGQSSSGEPYDIIMITNSGCAVDFSSLDWKTPDDVINVLDKMTIASSSCGEDALSPSSGQRGTDAAP